MATAAAYEGGIGGKFRKRPFRRPAATPYDRPQAAARGLRAHTVEEGSNGWLSKLVDPASRIITRSASRFFSSVFRKRLGAPPAAPEANLESGLEVPEGICINPLSEVQEGGGKDGEISINNSHGDGITELEQLLNQKTFTRVEFDRLTELLRSRTLDLSAENEKKGTEPNTSQPPVSSEKQENANVSAQENIVGGSKYFGSTSTPCVNLNIPEEEAASPAEVAKAYMGSRPSKVSPSTLGLRSQALRDATTLPSIVPFAPKPFDASMAPRSVVYFSGISGPSEGGYQTPRPRGRSAIYKMSRSPYFKGHSTVTLKGAGTIGDAYVGPSTSSKWIPTDVTLSGGKQVLKRRSSVFENDLGSVGPIRRIRQKSNWISPLKDINTSVSGKFLSTPSTPNVLDVIQGSTSSTQKTLMLDGTNYAASNLQNAENGEDSISCGRLAAVPPKSAEMARKIFQQIDKLVPSPPKEKSFELKASKDESPPKLTLSMLHGRALRSVEDIDSSKIHNVADNGKLESPSDTHLQSRRNSSLQKQARVEENRPSNTAISGVKLASEVDRMDNVMSVTDTKPVTRAADFHFLSSTAVPQQSKPAFQMQAPEDSLELDDDNYGSRDAPSPSPTGKENLDSAISGHKVDTPETTVPGKPLVSSFDGRPTSSSTLDKEDNLRGPGRPVIAEKDTGFTFPVVPSPSIVPQPPSTPTMPNPLANKSAPAKEQTSASMCSFGSKSSPTSIFSSTSTSFSNPEVLRFGANSDSKLEVLGSATTVTATPIAPVEIANSDRGDKTQKAGYLFKSFGNAAPLGTSMSTTPTFGTSTPSLSNGSFAPTMSIFSVSAASVAQLSTSSACPIVSSTGTTNGVSNVSTSDSPPTFPVLPSFKFGSSTSAVPTDSVLPPVVKSESKDLESKPIKESPFGTSFSSPATSSVFSNTGSGIFGFGTSVPSSATCGSTPGSVFGVQTTQSGSGISPFTQSTINQFSSSASSPMLGLGGASSFSSSSSAFGSSTSSANSFGSSSGFGMSSAMSFTVGTGSSSPANSSSSTLLASTASIFSSSSQSATQSVFGSGFGSSTSSPSTGFSFGLMPASSGSAPLLFGTSSGPAFSFTSATSTTSSACVSPAQTAFGMPTPAVGFTSGSPGNDQMNVEDNMTDDTVQTTMPVVPAFGQPANAPVPSNFAFGSPAAPSGAPSFQFVSHQSSAFPQSQSPFQAASSLDFAPGGSFSLGSGGGDKSSRRIIKIKRDKNRKK